MSQEQVSEKEGKFSCAGCGCLGLILVIIAVLIWYFAGHLFMDGDKATASIEKAKTFNEKMVKLHTIINATSDSLPLDTCYYDILSSPYENNEVQIIYNEDLERFVNPNYEVDIIGDFEFMTSFDLVNTPVFEKAESKAAIFKNISSIDAISELNYVAVVTPTITEWPNSRGGESFESGYFLGLLVLYDLTAKQVICYDLFTAINSDMVEFKDRELDFKNEDDFLKDDLEKNILAELNKAINKIDASLHLEKSAVDELKDVFK